MADITQNLDKISDSESMVTVQLTDEQAELCRYLLLDVPGLSDEDFANYLSQRIWGSAFGIEVQGS
tara:strand:- start:367 stop:564 length:198 start_codon:yes stop_codon:yes gene_type:complete